MLKEELQSLAAAARERLPAVVLISLERMIADLAARNATASALAVGQMLPEFVLLDAAGRTTFGRDLHRDGPLVLVFYRGDWCPYCTLHLRALSKMAPTFQLKKIALAAIAPAPAKAAEQTQLGYPLLHDPGNDVARACGLVWEMPPDVVAFYKSRGLELTELNRTEAWELPFAASFVIAPDGRVTYAKIDFDFRERAEPADLLAAAEQAVMPNALHV